MEEVKDSSPENQIVGTQLALNDSDSSQNFEYPLDPDVKSLTSTCSSIKFSFDNNSSSSFKSEAKNSSKDSESIGESRKSALKNYKNYENSEISEEEIAEKKKKESKKINFDEKFRKYYVEPNKNNSANFDNYLSKALTLISYFPPQDADIFLSQIAKKKIFSKNLNGLIKFDPCKKTLILDMDETLLHTDVDCQYQYHDELLNVDIGSDKNVLLPLIKRPFLSNFLSFAKENFNLILFTASQKEYAEPILDYIEKREKYFCLKLFRNSCLFLDPGITIKDLRIFSDIPLEDILIIENNLFAFANQLNNGILLSSFFHDSNDQMLLNLIRYLTSLLDSDDILEKNKNTFKFNEYLQKIRNGLLDLQ